MPRHVFAAVDHHVLKTTNGRVMRNREAFTAQAEGKKSAAVAPYKQVWPRITWAPIDTPSWGTDDQAAIHGFADRNRWIGPRAVHPLSSGHRNSGPATTLRSEIEAATEPVCIWRPAFPANASADAAVGS